MVARSVLLSSNYQAWPEAFNGQAYAFLNVIRQLEDADLMCPPPAPYASGRGVNPSISYLYGELAHRARSALRRQLGFSALSNATPMKIERDYDLFMFMCQFPRELVALGRLRDWRRRSGKAVAYLLETWPDLLESQKHELRLLDAFDHVFVLNAGCVEPLQRYTSAQVSYLPSACDAVLATPMPNPPERNIDVFSIGRRMPQVHEKLLAHASANPEFFYVHDVTRGGTVPDWQAHRLQSAAMIKRSKFFMAYDFLVDKVGTFKGIKKQALATRYFEGIAGGAVILGGGQHIPEFQQCFDWQDAVVEMPVETSDVGEFITELSQQRERLQHIRTTNMVQALRRHDWAHRWAQILDTLGLPRPGLMDERLEMLDGLAAMASQQSRIDSRHVVA